MQHDTDYLHLVKDLKVPMDLATFDSLTKKRIKRLISIEEKKEEVRDRIRQEEIKKQKREQEQSQAKQNRSRGKSRGRGKNKQVRIQE